MTFPSHSLLFDLTINHLNVEIAHQNVIAEAGKKARLGFTSETGILKRTKSFYHASSNKPNDTARGKQLVHSILYPSLPSEHLLFHHGLSQLPLLYLLSLEKAKLTWTRKLPLHSCPSLYFFPISIFPFFFLQHFRLKAPFYLLNQCQEPKSLEYRTDKYSALVTVSWCGIAISRNAQFRLSSPGPEGELAPLPFEDAVCNLQHLSVQRKRSKGRIWGDLAATLKWCDFSDLKLGRKAGVFSIGTANSSFLTQSPYCLPNTKRFRKSCSGWCFPVSSLSSSSHSLPAKLGINFFWLSL